MIANPRVETNPFNNLPGIQPQALGIAVELVEVGNAHGQVGVGKEFNGFGFGGIRKQHFNIFLNRPFLKQSSESLCTF